jgi:LPPG:FO 2-phospho-L-lactate transferase
VNVVLLAGGTGGAKLAVGLRDILHGFDGGEPDTPGQLTVIANTADDIEIYDVLVCPDPDLISFRLAGVLNAAGYGIDGEGHEEMDARRAAGEDIWFELGDEDLLVCAVRTTALDAGQTLTAAQMVATRNYNFGGAIVLPMSDQPVRTIVDTPNGPRGIQQFLIQDRSGPAIEGVRFEGAGSAAATPQCLDAIAEADLIVVGPSNPAISIAPILETDGMLAAIDSAEAPVLAVSPFVGGRVLKGPTENFLAAAGHAADSSGAAAYYRDRFGGFIDAWMADDPVAGAPHHLAGVEMSDPDQTRIVAGEALRYGASLARSSD